MSSLNGLNNGIDTEYFRLQEQEHERVIFQRRFSDMNRQIGEITSFVKTLTQHESNPKLN